MAIFRVEKIRDFTTMSNHHFKNRHLTLKAKGLLSLMLSLPDNWDYTERGLTYLCRDGRDSISSAIQELEHEGYLTRKRLRSANGRRRIRIGTGLFKGYPMLVCSSYPDVGELKRFILGLRFNGLEGYILCKDCDLDELKAIASDYPISVVAM